MPPGQYQSLQLADVSSKVWQPENAPKHMRQLEDSLLWHSLLVWVVMPACIVAQTYVPLLEPTCLNGYTNWSLLLLLVLEIHHILAERRGWMSLRSLTSPPELSILRQLGVLARRRWYVLLGILEDVDLYTDLTFPFVALACDLDGILTEKWSEAWLEVPLVGPTATRLLERIRFFGVALLAVLLNVLVSGIWKIISMYMDAVNLRRQMGALEEQNWRIPGRVFFSWAQAAETAMMPSIAVFSEELAAQQRWRWNKQGNAAASTKAREDFQHGKITEDQMFRSETFDREEEEMTIKAEVCHFNLVLFQKVFLGNVLALWLQSSFLALTWEEGLQQPRTIKLVVSMIFSALQAIVRCWRVSRQTGPVGIAVSLVVCFFVVWSFVKVWKAYQCPEHLWNLTTGCVMRGA